MEGTGSGTTVESVKTPADTVLSDQTASGQPPPAGSSTPDASKASGDGATGAAGEKTAGKDGAADASKAPLEYTLSLPDDINGLIDDTDIALIRDTATKSKWSQEDASAAVGELVAMVQAQSSRFLAETTADPTYGGQKLAESQKLAQAVIQKIRPPGHPRYDSFQKFLARGGAGNHIEVVSFLADLGRLMAEDTPPQGRASGAGAKDAATLLYTHPSSIALQERAGGGSA